MASQRIILPPESTRSDVRPAITSFDSGYEHSPEHMVEVRRLVADAAEEPARPSVKSARPMAVSAQAASS